jgi:hypothetical protein
LLQQQPRLKSLAFSNVSGEAFSAVTLAPKKRKLKKKRKLVQADLTVVVAARAKTAAIVRATVDQTTAIATATAMKVETTTPAMANAQRLKQSQLTDHLKSQLKAEAATNSLDLQPSQKHVSKKLMQQPLHLRQLTRALKPVKVENLKSVQMTSVVDHVVAVSVRMFQPMLQSRYLQTSQLKHQPLQRQL